MTIKIKNNKKGPEYWALIYFQLWREKEII